IAGLTGGGGSSPEATFHAYPGDGTFTIADGLVPTNYVARTGHVSTTGNRSLDFSLAYLTSLYDQNATHLGLMVWQENYGQSVDLSRGNFFGPPPTVRFTVDTPDPIVGFFNGDFQ